MTNFYGQYAGFGAGVAPEVFMVASGGTVTTVDTDYKVHTFTSSGTFAVSTAGTAGAQYLVIAGGGSGGNYYSGGGGAGGYRNSMIGETTGGGGSAEDALAVADSTDYTVTIGGGGTGPVGAAAVGDDGNDSVFGSIT